MAFKARLYQIGKLRVVLVPDSRESVMVEALIGVGSREENNQKAGVSHFLEHFILKGTRLFPGAQALKEAVEKVGGVANAFTGQEQTGFYVKVGKENLELAVRLVGQQVGEPLLEGKYFERERGTILEELYMYEDDPGTKAGEEATKLLFGETSGVGRPIIGTIESLRNLTVADVRSHFEQWFLAENIIVGVVGNWGGDDKRVLGLIEKEFGSVLQRPGSLGERQGYNWPKQVGGRRLIRRKLEQAHVGMAFGSIELVHPLRHAANLTNIVLGGGWISRLVKEIREKRGWAYSIHSDLERLIDVGELSISAGLPKSRLEEALKLIEEIVFGLERSGSKWAVREKDLRLAKQFFAGRMSLAFDLPERVLAYSLRDLMFEGKIYSLEEIKERTEGVSLEQVLEFCQLTFDRKKMSLVVVGDYEEIPKLETK